MTRTEKILATVVTAHLALAVFGAIQFDFEKLGAAGEALDYYGQLSGTSNSYGFFAPEIGEGLRTEFDIELPSGIVTTRLETGNNREADLRVGNILGILSRNVEDEKARRVVAASWAGKMFSKYPEARNVNVRMETRDVPTMREFKEGKRHDWKIFYRAKFERRGPKATR